CHFQPILAGVDYTYAKSLLITLATTITFYIVDLYDSGLLLRKSEFFVKISTCLVIIFFTIASINFLVPSLQLHSMDYLLSLIVFIPVIIGFRCLYYLAINISKEKIIILGFNAISGHIAPEVSQGGSH